MMKLLDEIGILLTAFMLVIFLHLIAALLNTTVVEVMPGIVCYLWARTFHAK